MSVCSNCRERRWAATSVGNAGSAIERSADVIWLLEIVALAIVGLGVLAVWRDHRAPAWLRAAWLL